MQVLMALNAIANDGVYVAPRYVLGRQTGDGKFIPEPASDERRVISAESAATVNKILQSVVSAGTGTAAQVPGFTVAGKTGTAWKPQDPHHIYDHYLDPEGRRHLSSSFMGYLPADDPQLSIMVILDDMIDTSKSGGKVAAPVFSAIGEFVTRLMNIAPTTEADVSPVRVRAKAEVPPPPTTEATTTTVPGSPPTTLVNTAPTTAAKAGTPTTAATPPTTRAPATNAPATTPVPTTARAPTAASSG
jgi:cell division protein FtsI (penicillin-binding protein 3)